jgi:hypothetical protein
MEEEEEEEDAANALYPGEKEGADGDDGKSDNDDAKNANDDLDFGETLERFKQQRDTERRSGISSVVDGLETPEVDLRKI